MPAPTIGTDPAAMSSALSALQGQASQAVSALTKANQGVQQTAEFARGGTFDSIRSQTNDDVNKAVNALNTLLTEVGTALNKVSTAVANAAGG